MRGAKQVLKRKALRVEQEDDHPLYLFTLEAADLNRIAAFSRVSRDEAGKLVGYQRPAVKKHVDAIADYLNSGRVLFPNPIILALSTAVSFKRARGPKNFDGLARAGVLSIPLPRPNGSKPAWIVDGQQRALALARCRNPRFPVPVNAFVSDDVATQKDQFLRINSAKPLSRARISELLPDVETLLPPQLEAKKAPARLCQILAFDPHSPFFGMIRHPSMAPKERRVAVVTNTGVVEMIAESMRLTSGCLQPYVNRATQETDYEAIRRVLFAYWEGVRRTFPEAWGKPPSASRLMHEVGVRAMGQLMDAVMSRVDPFSRSAASQVRRELIPLRPYCHWTSGVWSELGGRRWNDLQVTRQDIALLGNGLLRRYLAQTGRKVA